MSSSRFQGLLDKALQAANQTKHLAIGRDNAGDAARIFRECFPGKQALVVADNNTFPACGKAVYEALTAAGIDVLPPFIYQDPALYAEYKFVDEVEAALAQTEAIAIAVGSGSINDLVKLASHHLNRRYMSVATAASMDGYTAYGASITYKGSKQTFDCPAPLAVVADLDVIARAPEGMNASGYADLLAKLPAGADWIVADALGVERIDPASWEMVQQNLRDWLSDPAGVARGDAEPLESLVAGLMMGGFAMQHLQSSRPASGAEHQFSHLWDMESHKHNGKSPSHGFKVGIGTVSSARLYEFLYTQDFDTLDVAVSAAAWPEWDAIAREIESIHTVQEIREKSLEEARAKYADRDTIAAQLAQLKAVWPELREKLKAHLPASSELASQLAAAGAPNASEQIGIPADRLRDSYRKALHLRRRFTVLDLAHRAGVFARATDALFT